MLAGGCASQARPEPIGLFTSLPILWPEAGDIGGLLHGDRPPHWAMPVLQAQGQVEPVDSFLPGPRGAPLSGLRRLVMAQPRPLAPEENVALDRWVRGGGKLLLFADPMLTAHSAFAIGDRRRPEDMAMLSPILGRWGLRLEFDEDQAAGERSVIALGVSVPVNLPGRLVLDRPKQGCVLLAGGLAAQCRIGKGRVLILADAAMLEDGGDAGLPERRTALESLLAALAVL